jgi:hypothetical protein
MYYDGKPVSSVYTLDCAAGQQGFNAAFLVKNELEGGEIVKHPHTHEVYGPVDAGCWDGVHIVMVTLSGSSATYMVISTV